MPEAPVQPPPRVTAAEAEALALEHWSISASAEPLPSYIDANFRMRARDDDESFVLKIANAYEPPAELEMQDAAMQWIEARAPGTCPRPCPTPSGATMVSARVGAVEHLIRLVTYLPGGLYAHARPRDATLLRSLGSFVGALDRTLEGFEHDAADRYLRWDLKQAGWIAEYLHEIEHPERQRLARGWLELFRETVEPRLHELPVSVIHNDANDFNLIVGERDGATEVTGIIDFGDMVRSHTVFELAIASAYAMMDQHDILAALAHVVSGYHGQRPLSEAEQELLVPLIGLRLATSVTTSAHEARLDPDNEYIRISERPAWRVLEQLAAAAPGLARATVENACAGDDPMAPRATHRVRRERMRQDRAQRLGTALSLSYAEPLHIVRGSGQHLFDDEGRAFLDCVNNVCHVGHAHPGVVEALASQAAVLNTNTRYLHPNIVEYARRLTALFPDPLSVCYLVCTGSEANDLALRMARAHTGQRGVVVVDGAYHGNLSSLIEISPYKCEGPGGGGLAEHVRKVAMPDRYRGIHRDEAATAERYAEDVGRAVADLRQSGLGPGAFICESILGCGGQIVLPEGYLERAHGLAREAGAVCIADEVQVGFGRVGSHWWGFETQGVTPDIVTLGKPIGNGHPLAAVVTTPEIARSFDNGMEYFNTFGGNPVSCAVGLAVLDAIESGDLREHARVVGGHLLDGLRGLMENHPCIGDARGVGLFLGLELVRSRDSRAPDAEVARAAVEAMRERGVLLSTDGPDHNVIKIKPPLVFTREDADALVSGLDAVLPR